MEELLDIVNIKKNDKNTILEFLYTYAENSELRESLTLKNSNCFDMYLQDWIRDLESDTIRPYRKSDFIMYKLPYHSKLLEENMAIDRREQFLDEILNWWKDKEAIISFLQEFIWWLFVPNSCFEIALLIHGVWANWKWVLLETIKYILWDDNSIGLWLHELAKEQNTYLLLNKLALIDSDMQQNVQLDSWIIKKIISWERVTWKMVYAKPISFSPVAKILVATNELPYIKSIDQSIKRRFVFLHLKHSFLGKEDPLLKKKLQDERDWIFARAFKWAVRLVKRKHFDVPLTLKEDLADYIKEHDSVEAFLDEWLVDKWWHLFIPNSNLYNMYKMFCKESWYKALWLKKLLSRLEQKWYKKHRTTKFRWIAWLGCQVNDFE